MWNMNCKRPPVFQIILMAATKRKIDEVCVAKNLISTKACRNTHRGWLILWSKLQWL